MSESETSFIDWLALHGLAELGPALAAQHVGFDTLGDITEADLKELGFTLGQRKRLMRAIGERLGGAVTVATTHPELQAETITERRHLTVMFCDLVGSSRLSDRMDTEDYLEIIQAYRAFCTQIVNRYEGFVARFIGDGILCYFGYPIGHENDAERAVRAGLEITRGLGAVTTPDGSVLEARIGLTTGVVIVGDLYAPGGSERQEIVGATPNLAARIHSAARPGEVLVAESTYRLVRGLFTCESLGRRVFRGFSTETALWRVQGERRMTTRFRARRGRRPATLVNRVVELEMLRTHWKRSLVGEGGGLVIVGEAGIGKSRVVEHFAHGVEGAEAVVHRYTAGPFSAQSPLFPLIAFLTRAASIRRGDDVGTRRRKLENLIWGDEETRRAGMPILAELLSVDIEQRLNGELSPRQIREQTFAFVIDQMERRAAASPLLLIVEDIHWLDPTSLELLEQLIPRLERQRILLIATCRDEEQVEWIERSGLAVLRQGRLDPEHARALIQTVLGDRRIDPTFAAQIVSKTDGNPLFLEEFTSTVVDAVEQASGLDRFAVAAMPPIPDSLHEILVARLDQAGEAKTLAQVGAVLGRSFSRPLIEAVAAREGAGFDGSIAALLASGLLFETQEQGEAHYSFKHALVQDAAYRTLLRDRRWRLHAVAAEEIRRLTPEVEREQPEMLAHHLTEANLYDQAVTFWLRAGERNLQRSALPEAVTQLRRCLEVLGHLPPEPEHLEQRLRVLVLLGPALISLKGPGSREVEDIYTSAYETCRLLPESRTHYPVFWGWWRMSEDYRDKTRRFEALLERAQVRSDPELLLQAHHCGWGSYFGLAQFGACCEHIDKGLAIYEAGDYRHHATLYGNHDAKVCALGERALVYWLQGAPEQALAQERRAMAWAAELGHDGSYSHCIDIAVMHSAYRRDIPAVRERAATMLRLAEEKGFSDHLSKGRLFLGWTAALGGDPLGGLAMLREGLAQQKDSGTSEDFPVYYCMLAEVLELAGRPDEGLAELEYVHDVCNAAGLRIWMPEVLRRIGELRAGTGAGGRDAEAALREALALAHAQDARALGVRAALSLARARGRAGDHEEARAILRPYLTGAPEWLAQADVQAAHALYGAGADA
ncbi:adenylate/guanylate cyclase domain-containing protein [Alsobacter metallidurans]|uniref:Adenylate/guanylate cyclase domain-containing protein n=1 Tax=Alsobacter metallidurans TaxID=340221 RepID=A0A917MKG1_9HYPH|nr:adenylate/guanylate cyclase domain-containing protein [Alsobacter metallidurans]GGH23507.1 adenylate/guanylate cyclase domain-containing protein [Alsobacter metallidurans]